MYVQGAPQATQVLPDRQVRAGQRQRSMVPVFIGGGVVAVVLVVGVVMAFRGTPADTAVADPVVLTPSVPPSVPAVEKANAAPGPEAAVPPVAVEVVAPVVPSLQPEKQQPSTPVSAPVAAQQVLANVVSAVGLDTGVAASSSDGRTVWIEPASGTAQLLSDRDGVVAAAVQLDTHELVLGYTSGRVQLWDTAQGREVASQPPIGQSAVASLSVGNGNKSVLAKYRAPGAFRLFDANLQEVPQPWPTVGALLGDEAQLAPDA